MKKSISNYFILIYFFIFGIISCQRPVAKNLIVFDKPQPVDIKDLAKIPKNLQAIYLSKNSSEKLLIDDKTIILLYNDTTDAIIHKNELDSSVVIKGDSIFFGGVINEKSTYKRLGDSLKIHSILFNRDTLFSINDDNIIRKFRGYFFISSRVDENSWEVEKISLSRGILIKSRLSSQEEIDQLKEITQIPQDTIYPYKVSLSKKQFQKFLKEKNFCDADTFIRIKNK